MVSFVATPIGNLGDITFRAVETLKNADEIYCEDTRHTLRLLNAYEIKKPLYACHKFNERQAAEKNRRRKRSRGKTSRSYRTRACPWCPIPATSCARC